MVDSENNGTSVTLGQRLGIGMNVLISILALLAVLVMVNYLAARHFRRFDLSQDRRAELSPMTLRLLKSLTNDVQVTVYFDADLDRPIYGMVAALLKEYASQSPHIKWKKIDFVRDPGAAKEFRSKYKLPELAGPDKELVLFECDKRTRFVLDSQLADFNHDFSGVMGGESKEIKRTIKNFRGELEFSSAILGVAESRPSKAYFLQSHGEHDPDEQTSTGYARFNTLLNQNNIDTARLVLTGTNEVPADCQLLIIAGPTHSLFPEELESIEKYLRHGGRLLALLNFHAVGKPTGLERLLRGWGVDVGNNQVLDPEFAQQATLDDMAVLEFGNHPVVTGLVGNGLYIYMYSPRSIGRLAGNSGPDAPKVEPLAFTSKGGFIKDSRDGAPLNVPAERKGVIPLMVAVEKGAIAGVSADHATTRIVVTGDSIFLANETLDKAANRDFASLAVNWLLDRSVLLGGIGPRAVTQYAVSLTNSQFYSARILLLLVLPGLAAVSGLFVWFKRRS